MALKHYIDGRESITEMKARAKYPNPHFLRRASMDQSQEMAAAYVLRNVEELRRILDIDEKLARGQVAGGVTKRHLVAVANRLHNWRVSMNMMSGGLGQPHLWEE
jgi:hypothetical protein